MAATMAVRITPTTILWVLSKCFQDKLFVNPLGSRFSLWQQRAQFLNTPNMIANSSLHRWRDSQSAVYSAEVVMQKVQRDHVTMVFQPLTKSVCQVSEAPHPHAH
jgi:hypothetical protein